MKTLTLTIFLALTLAACGHQDEPVAEPKTSVFGMWASSDLGQLDLSAGRQGVFDTVIYRVYQGNPYRCYATLYFKGNTAQVLDWWQNRSFPGAECGALFRDVSDGILKTFVFDIVEEKLQVSEKKADGNVTLAWIFVQDQH